MVKIEAPEFAPVTWEVRGGVGVITIDAANGNALTPAIIRLLVQALQALDHDSSVTAIIIAGVQGHFLVSPEFGSDGEDDDQEAGAVLAAIETSTKPIVAAITGPALDIGFEVALVCDLRIADPSATAGLPGLLLGCPPRDGATQRLPRLLGVAASLDLIAASKPVRAQDALTLGIFDQLTSSPVRLAMDLAASTLKDRISQRSVPAEDPAKTAASFEAVAKRARGIEAIEQTAQLVANAGSMNFEDGLLCEQVNFKNLHNSLQARALRYLRLAESWAKTVPGLSGIEPRTIAKTAVVGAGTMGSGIAYSLAAAGLPVVVLEQTAETATNGRDRIDGILQSQQKAGRLDGVKSAEIAARVQVTEDWQAAGDADLVIEAAFEDIDVKTEIFGRLDSLLKPGAVLATNTSYLDVDVIARRSRRAEDMVGLHFFSPAHVMRLLEVVQADKTTPAVLATALSLARRIGKLPIVARVCDGFIGNRIFAVYRRHAEYLLEDGASPQEIDHALQAYGFAMGPFAVSDMSGLDIAWAMRKRRAAKRDPQERYVSIPDILCETGRLGRKVGAGWYDYVDGKPGSSQTVEQMIVDERQKRNVAPRTFSAVEIQRRIMAVMANEGAKVLEEGISARASDIDLVFVNGYGFPRLKGGPMFAADTAGLAAILAEVEMAARTGGAGSEPSALLVQLVRSGSTFAAWQRENSHVE
jgi:3-hydroxyacyl-CoA dehydrogenase